MTQKQHDAAFEGLDLLFFNIVKKNWGAVLVAAYYCSSAHQTEPMPFVWLDIWTVFICPPVSDRTKPNQERKPNQAKHKLKLCLLKGWGPSTRLSRR